MTQNQALSSGDIPDRYDINMLDGLIKALKQLGGNASATEVAEKTGELLNLNQDSLNAKRKPEDSQTIFVYQLHWTKWALDKYGLIESSQRGVWQLTKRGWQISEVNEQARQEILEIKDKYLRSLKSDQSNKDPDDIDDYTPNEIWKNELLTKLRSITPYSFELLCKNFLSQLGLEDVEVTSKTADGGIDGSGIITVNGVIGFKMAFQCKRYSGSVSAPDIQKFRGATSQFEKALFITTGTFTTQAKHEAEIAPRIDLVDGDTLADKMAELGLGVKKDQIVVDYDYFAKFETNA